MAFSMAGAAKVISGVAGGAAEAQSVLKDLIEAGNLRTVIDRRGGGTQEGTRCHTRRTDPSTQVKQAAS
jgi:hypothetical protein